MRLIAVIVALAAAMGLVTGTAAAVDKSVPFQYQQQETGYWCAAASARIALTAKGKYIPQSTLASYMGIRPDIGLPNINNLKNALNHYTGVGYYQVKQWGSDAELRTRLLADVKFNVDRGWATVINVTRLGGRSYPGGHYAVIVGYRGSTHYAISDPAYPQHQRIWLTVSDVTSGIKLRRYVA